jgi:predicted nucleic acid-binding protein
MRYVVDTDIFNHLLDERIDRSVFPTDAELVATHIQIDEIKRTKLVVRRTELLSTFATVAPSMVPAESGFWGAGGQWGMALKWSSGQRAHSIIAALDAIKKKRSNKNDALIGEVAMGNGYGLLTSDSALFEVMTERNVATILIVPKAPLRNKPMIHS